MTMTMMMMMMMDMFAVLFSTRRPKKLRTLYLIAYIFKMSRLISMILVQLHLNQLFKNKVAPHGEWVPLEHNHHTD